MNNAKQSKNIFHQTPVSNNNHQNGHTLKARLEKGTIWFESHVKRHIQRRADEARISFSALGAKIFREWAEKDISKQNQDLLELKLRHMMREEIRASDNRFLPFHMTTAFAAEQLRILLTNALKMIMTQLLKMPVDKFEQLVADSAKMARRNIIQKSSPQIKSLIEEWMASNTTQ